MTSAQRRGLCHRGRLSGTLAHILPEHPRFCSGSVTPALLQPQGLEDAGPQALSLRTPSRLLGHVTKGDMEAQELPRTRRRECNRHPGAHRWEVPVARPLPGSGRVTQRAASSHLQGQNLSPDQKSTLETINPLTVLSRRKGSLPPCCAPSCPPGLAAPGSWPERHTERALGTPGDKVQAQTGAEAAPKRKADGKMRLEPWVSGGRDTTVCSSV